MSAEDVAIGGVQQQEGKNIAFISQKLQGAEKNYSVHDKEMLTLTLRCLRAPRTLVQALAVEMVVAAVIMCLTAAIKRAVTTAMKRAGNVP